MNLETDLRITSDRMLKTLEQVAALESEKRTLQPGSERFNRLAVEVERLAAAIFAQTHNQQQLGEKAKEVTERTGVELTSIDDSEPLRELQMILSDWRDAERRLSLCDPDTAEHAQAAADVSRLRDEYHRAYTSSQRDTGR